jgi:hypothetical protein
MEQVWPQVCTGVVPARICHKIHLSFQAEQFQARSNIIMRDHASSNADDSLTKSTIVKAGTTFTSPKMVRLPPCIDLQSSLSSLPNRPRILSLEFHASPRPVPRIPLLSRNLLTKLVDAHQDTPDSMDLDAFPPDARTVRAPSPLSSPFNTELPLLPRAARPDKDEMCFTPAPSFDRDTWMPAPPALEREVSRILLSPTMPHELFVPDDF